MKFTSFVRVACVAVIAMVSTPIAHASPRATTPAALHIISQPFNISGATGTRFVVQAPATVRNIPNATLQIQLHRRVSQRQSFQAIASGEAVSAVLDTVTYSLSSIARISNGYLSIPLPVTVSTDNASSLFIPNDGVYPISVRVVNSNNEVIALTMTYMNKRQSNVSLPAVQASTLVRLISPPSIDTKGEFELTGATRAAVQRMTTFLKSVEAPITVAVQPEIIASLTASPDPADKILLNALVDQLRTRTVIATTYIPLDASMLASGNLDDEFIKLLRMGESTLSQLLPNVSVQRNTYIADAQLSDAAISMLYKAGVAAIILTGGAQEKATYQSSSNVLSQPNRPQRAMSVVSADRELSKVIGTTDTDGVGLEVGYRLAAEMLVQRDDLIAAGVQPQSIRLLMTTPNGAPALSSSLQLATNTLAITPGIAMTDFSTPQTVTPETPVVKFANSSGLPTSRANAILELRSEISDTASMTKETDALRLKWDQLLAAGASTVAPDPAQYIDGLRTSLAATRASVTVTTPSNISLSSKDGVIRLQIRNGSTSELTVRVQLSSAKVNFVDPIRTITLTAGGTTEVQVSATTRTNGRFPIALRVYTPEGNLQVLPVVTITARVNALAGFGQAVSVGVLLILLAWWWSHRRKARLEAASGTTVSQQ